jgi:hypothetical protein
MNVDPLQFPLLTAFSYCAGLGVVFVPYFHTKLLRTIAMTKMTTILSLRLMAAFIVVVVSAEEDIDSSYKGSKGRGGGTSKGCPAAPNLFISKSQGVTIPSQKMKNSDK